MSTAPGGINRLRMALFPERFHLVEAFGTGQAHVTRYPGQRPEAFRRLQLLALETESRRIVVHAAPACSYASRSVQTLLFPGNKQ